MSPRRLLKPRKKPSGSWPSILGKVLFLLFILPAILGVGLAVLFHGISRYVPDPFRTPFALIAFVAYIYVVARWVLRLKTRPIFPPSLKNRLQRLGSEHHVPAPPANPAPTSAKHMHPFTCPACKETYDIEIYNLGLGGECEARCDQCGASVGIPVMVLAAKGLLSKESPTCEAEQIHAALNPCKFCGGQLRLDAPYRCKLCHSPLDLAEIKRQINWWGAPDGVPGVIIRGHAGHPKLFKND